MEYTELKNKSQKELHDLLAEQRARLTALRFKAQDQQLKDVREIREVRATIARIMTALNAAQQKNNA